MPVHYGAKERGQGSSGQDPESQRPRQDRPAPPKALAHRLQEDAEGEALQPAAYKRAQKGCSNYDPAVEEGNSPR